VDYCDFALATRPPQIYWLSSCDHYIAAYLQLLHTMMKTDLVKLSQ